MDWLPVVKVFAGLAGLVFLVVLIVWVLVWWLDPLGTE